MADISGRKLPFVIMAKPVGSRCNMRCSYCYYLEKGKFSSHRRQTRMSDALLEKLIRQTIASAEGPVVSFTWHGGEPLLAGMDFFKKVVALEQKYLPRGQVAWNNLQTNGLMLLNGGWCKFLKDNHFDVGVSLDGAETIHDENRRDLGGGATYARIVRAVRKLQRFGIQPDLLCTVNADSLKDPLTVYRGLRDLESGWVQFIPIVVRLSENKLSFQSVTPEGYGRFLCAVFDEWLYHDLGKLDVQLFAETARLMAGGQASVCWMASTCGRVLIAEEDGSVYSCDHFVDHAHRLGNLMDTDLSKLANAPAQLAFGNAKRDALTKECRRCPYIAFCGGGCLKDRFGVSEDGEEGHYYLCAGMKMFFSHAVPLLSRVMEESRKGKTPAEIMRVMRSENI